MKLLPSTALALLLLLCTQTVGYSTTLLTYLDDQGQTLGTPITGTLNSIFTYSFSGATIYAPRPAGTVKARIDVLDTEELERMVDVRVGILPLDLAFEGAGVGTLVPGPGFVDSQMLRLSSPVENTASTRQLQIRGLNFGQTDSRYGIGLLVRSATWAFPRLQIHDCRFEGFTTNAIYSQDPETELNITNCRFVTTDPTAGLKQIRFSGNSTLPDQRLVTIQNCSFRVELVQPASYQAVTAVYAFGQVPRNLYLMNCAFDGFFDQCVYANQTYQGSVQVLGCTFDGPRPQGQSGLPHSMVKGVYLNAIGQALVSDSRFRGIAENCIHLRDCPSATAQSNVISEFGLTDGSCLLGGSFGITRVNARPWSQQSIPVLFEDFHAANATANDAERALIRQFAKSNAILLSASRTGTSWISDNSLIDCSSTAIYSVGGNPLPMNSYPHVIQNNLVSGALNTSIRINSSNTLVENNSIVNSAIDPEVYQDLLDEWGCDSEGFSRNFGSLFQYSSLLVAPGSEGVQHVRIAGNLIQRAANSILVEGTGLLPHQIPTGLEIHDNIIDTVLQPYLQHWTSEGICQDSLMMDFNEWRGIWVGDSHDVSILRNRVHNGHITRHQGLDWYVGGIGIQLDGCEHAEIRENLVDGVTTALVLATYPDSPGHLPYLRDVNCSSNVFHNIHGYSVPMQTPDKTRWLSSFRMGVFDSSLDATVFTPTEFSAISVRRNSFIWNLDGDPSPATSPARKFFDFTFPFRGPLPDCAAPYAAVHENIDFRTNWGNLGGRGELAISDGYRFVITGGDLAVSCDSEYPGYSVAQQNDYWSDLQANNPGSLFSSTLAMSDGLFPRTVDHPGFDELRILPTIGGTREVRIRVPPYTSVIYP
jgi:hypothetical protein